MKVVVEKRCAFVLSKDGRPLMPTDHFGKVRHLLDSGRARVVCTLPFTIRLKYDLAVEMLQELALGIDPGRTNIGVAVVREDGKCLYMAHVTTRNKQIPKLMRNRKEHRHNSRCGERLRRKRRAKKNNTTMKNGFIDRFIPGYSKPVRIKDIKNAESKFVNRKTPKGWLTPTATQLLRTHINVVKKVCKILPISKVCVEINKFAFMVLDNPGVSKGDIDFQRGPLYGYDSLRNAVYDIQSGICLLCGKSPIEHYHHVLPISKGGSNTYDNVAGLCRKCHNRVHTNESDKQKLCALHTKRNKKYGALTALNQIIPYLTDNLSKMFPNNAHITWGYYTKQVRENFGLDKTHDVDAYCIAIQCFCVDHIKNNNLMPIAYEIVQFRRQNRAIINNRRERTYKLNGVVVAKNRRKRVDQFADSLHEWYLKTKRMLGIKETRKLQSKLVVYKSKPSYNNVNRILPGATFKFDETYYILRGQQSNGHGYMACGYGNMWFPSKKCDVILNNTGLVYVS